jgi:CubicO group peptidase (beta-lactamase class C family)
MRALFSTTLVAATLSCASPAAEPPLPTAESPEVGLSAERLDLIRPAMQRYVDEGRVSGIVTMVARHGRLVHWDAVGWRDIESRDALERDDIFRIYSMTKPITSVAVMMLVEEGAISLDDPVSRYLPAFADVQVYSAGDLVPPLEPVSVADLLGHTSGLTYGFFGNTHVDSLYRAVNVFSGDLANLVDQVAALPLLDHPGSLWNYGVSTDVLGRLVETVGGQSFDEFLRARILSPLRMTDTGFFVPPGNNTRFTTNYTATRDSLRVQDPSVEGTYNVTPDLLSGGGGLVSTAADYVRFAQMLLNGGELDGVRILRPETIELMRTNRLAENLIPIRIAAWQAPGYGFGLGFSVLVDEDASPEPDNDGVFRWWGYASTYFWIDPEADLIGMVLTQLTPPTVGTLEQEFQTLVYNALEN